MAPIIIGLIIAGLIASPVAIDHGFGDQIHPEHPLYPVEQLGEQMKCSIGQCTEWELGMERLDEITQTKQRANMEMLVQRFQHRMNESYRKCEIQLNDTNFDRVIIRYNAAKERAKREMPSEYQEFINDLPSAADVRTMLTALLEAREC